MKPAQPPRSAAANEAARVFGLELNAAALDELARWHHDAELETILDYTVTPSTPKYSDSIAGGPE
jgi:hypothetical protein